MLIVLFLSYMTRHVDFDAWWYLWHSTVLWPSAGIVRILAQKQFLEEFLGFRDDTYFTPGKRCAHQDQNLRAVENHCNCNGVFMSILPSELQNTEKRGTSVYNSMKVQNWKKFFTLLIIASRTPLLKPRLVYSDIYIIICIFIKHKIHRINSQIEF